MDNDAAPERHKMIAGAISAELDRQAKDGNSRVDVDAVAEAIEQVIEHPAPADGPPAEGKRPEDLNSTNDD